MLISLLGYEYIKYIYFAGFAVSFALSFLSVIFFRNMLPHDKGRDFAVNGQLSKGKARGSGILFVITFIISTLLFVPIKLEYAIYLALTFATMITGFLDDAAKESWGELKKGLLDLVISIGLAVTYLYYNDPVIVIPVVNTQITIPVVLFGILIVILVWASINVTNCTDGVDGLCGILSCITLASIYFICKSLATDQDFPFMIILMIGSILAYLWFNSSPSQILMGDAGSRAIGFFIAIALLKSTNPIIYLLVGIVMILDGGLGLVKLTVLRTLKIKNFMSKLRTPVHDHFRKNLEWKDQLVVNRFAIIQVIICICAVYLSMK